MDNLNIIFSSYFQDDFFKRNYDIKTQLDVQNLIISLNIDNPELIIMAYDFLLDNIYNNIDKEDFILISDEEIKKHIREYLKLLMFNKINKIIAYKEYKKLEEYNESIKEGKDFINEHGDYLQSFKEIKKGLKYYDKYLKLLKSDDFIYQVISTVNKNKSFLSTEIKRRFKELKK